MESKLAVTAALIPEAGVAVVVYDYTMKPMMSLGGCALVLAAFIVPIPAGAQKDSTSRDPHSVQPERPTVATHAGTVARGWVELEEGAEWDKASDGTRAFVAPTNLKIGLASHAQLNLLASVIHDPTIRGGALSASDITAGLKYRIVEIGRASCRERV